MASVPLIDAGDVEAACRALAGPGACVLAGLPTARDAAALRADLARLHADGELTAAAVGRGGERSLRGDIRGDRTLWLDDARCGAPAGAHLQALEALRHAFNRGLFLGLRSVEAHYARYPAGTGYRRHRDRFRDDDARVLSLVSYLNPDWEEDDGGALRLHLDAGPVDLAPRGGTTACFLSGIEHEVRPARRERLSIAAWMRRDG